MLSRGGRDFIGLSGRLIDKTKSIINNAPLLIINSFPLGRKETCQSKMLSKTHTILSLGDSISVQYGANLQTALGDEYDLIRREGDSEASRNLNLPQGSNSGDSIRLREYIEHLAAGNGARLDLLVLNCGLHDIKRIRPDAECQVKLADYCENLRQIAAILRRRGMPAAWITTTHSNDQIHNEESFPGFYRFGSDVDEYNQVAREVMDASFIPVIDLHGFTRSLGPDSALFEDHVHFTDEVRRKQAAFLARWIRDWMSSRSPD